MDQVDAIPKERTRVDFWDLTKLVFRRWLIALPLLVLSIAATVYTAVTAKPDYVMTSYVQLIPPSVGSDANPNIQPRNPWYVLGLGTLGQASIYATQDQKYLNELQDAGHSINFSLTMGYPDPIITVQVVAATPQETIATMQLVIKRFQDRAQSLQKERGVRDQDMILTQRLDQGENLKASGGKVKRAIIAVAVVGLLFTTGLTVLFDAMARRRARRREQQEKINPLAVEIALARESATGAPNANETRLLPKVTAVRAEPAGQAPSEPIGPAPAVEPVPAEPAAPSVTPAAPPVPAAAPAPAGAKAARTLQAGTYRSVNAAAEADAGAGTLPAAPTSPAPPVPADVRIVLQPEWVAGENGGKRR
jgi:hypothetical protein